MNMRQGAEEKRVNINVKIEKISPVYNNNGEIAYFHTKDTNGQYTIRHDKETDYYNYNSYSMSFETCMFLMKHEFYFIQNNYGLDLYGVCKRKQWVNDMYVFRNIHDNKLYIKKDNNSIEYYNNSIEYCPTLEDFQANDWMII